MVDVVASEDVVGAAAADVDSVAVTEDLHDVVDFVVFDDVVVGVEVGADVF